MHLWKSEEMFMENKRYLKKQANLYDTAAYLHIYAVSFHSIYPSHIKLTKWINPPVITDIYSLNVTCKAMWQYCHHSQFKSWNQLHTTNWTSLTLLEYASSIASCDSLHKASMRWWRATSSKYWLDSKSRLNIAERTGRSAITAVVITAFESAVVRPAFRLPPVDGFRPRIHTKCCRQKDAVFQKTKYGLQSKVLLLSSFCRAPGS